MKKKRKRTWVLPLVLAAFLFAGALGVSCFWLLTGKGGSSAPPYEEASTGNRSLSAVIRKIDFSIYDILYRSGIPEKDIVFQGVKPRAAGEKHWEETRLLVRCSDGAKARALLGRIRKKLSPFKRVRIRKEKSTGRAFSFSILADGVPTHHMLLAYGEFGPEQEIRRPRIALIIDDLGYDLGLARGFMNLKIPVGLSILPCAPFTRRIAAEGRRRGCELMVHLPMEPKGYPAVNPGPGTLYTAMDAEQIRTQLREDLKRVPGAQGVNNHMGSLFTEDRRKMKIVLGALKRRHLFFVDSRTTPESVGYDLARELGVPAAKRTVFLDNDLHSGAIASQVRRLLSMARQKGQAIGIGHPHRETLSLLEKETSLLWDGVTVVPVAELLGH